MGQFIVGIFLPVIIVIFLVMVICDAFNDEAIKRQKIFDEAYDNDLESYQFPEDTAELEAERAFNKRLDERKTRVARRAGRRFRSGYLG